MSDSMYEDLLQTQLEEIGVEATPAQLNLLLTHLDLMLEKNKSVNLTSVKDKRQAITIHIVDSLTLLPLFQQTKGVFLDLGTGGGYPGIPLGIMSDRKGILLDSVTKKVSACSDFISSLGLGQRLSVSNERVEQFGLSHRGQIGCVCVRAVAPLETLLEYSSPLLSHGGSLILSKGTPSDEEVANAHKVAPLVGMKCVSHEVIELPLSSGHRELFMFSKVGKSQVKLPRAVGEARHKPLSAS